MPGERFIAEMRKWREGMARTGSPLYADLFARVADDVEGGGIFARVFDGCERATPEEALPLRVAGRVHRLVLEGRAPELAAHYPSAGGRVRGEATWRAFRSTVEANLDEVRSALATPPQTNEVGRCAALIGGFLEVARRFDLPLRVLEVGASAGLNLRWDHYRYKARGATWGPADSPVRLCSYNTQRKPPFDVAAEVTERRGCDLNPVDPTTAEGRLTLLSFVWPDQVHRIRLMRSALEVARTVPAIVDRAGALEWTRARLVDAVEGRATVVFHSLVLQYLEEQERAGFLETLARAGDRASKGAPLAHLQMEADGPRTAVILRTWPDGTTQKLAHSGFHGAEVDWLV